MFRIGKQTRVIALHGAVRHEAEADLREALVGAIENGARAILLDLTGVECIVPSADELIVAAGAMLSDRGGVLLTCRQDTDKGGPTYVIAEMNLDPPPSQDQDSRRHADSRSGSSLDRQNAPG